tara:strand:+ start:50 stop:472 length:423 start_codon:yes stop_codon:yes gene_type:complete
MIVLNIKHSKVFEDGYHEGWCNFSVNGYEFFGYGEPDDYNKTEIGYWLGYFSNLEKNILNKKSYYFWQFDTCDLWIGFNFIDNENIEVLSGELDSTISMSEVESVDAPEGLKIEHKEIVKVTHLLKAIRDSLSLFNNDCS